MLVWTRWGIAIPFLGYLGFLAGTELALVVGQQLQSNAPWLMATGQTAGAMAASLLVGIFRDWRSTRGGESQRRAMIEERTGARVEFQDPGDTFFWIHSRRWIWIMLLIGAGCIASTLYQQIPLQRL